MTAEALKVIWWILGTFGVAGLVAFWFLAPTAAQLTLQAVVRLFSFVLGYRVGCALLAAIVVGLAVDYERHAYDDEQFAKRTAAFEAAQIERDANAERKAAARVAAALLKQAELNTETDTRVKDFRDVLPPTPPTGNVFRIGDGDADRLCAIAFGKAGCGPDSRKGMSETRRKGARSDDKRVRFPRALRRIIGDD